MSLISVNSLDPNIEDINYDTSAKRIGRRLRRIRSERKLTQKELGELVNLSADRIQKYENGARKPKPEMLKQFAHVLEVDVTALMDPIPITPKGAMFAFFEMEDALNLKIRKIQD